jgi:hypothetical protein
LNELDKTIVLIKSTDYGRGYYGERDKVIDRVVALAEETDKALGSIHPKGLVVFDWAGIGDAIHSRLIVQHLAKEQEVSWITTPQVAPLYKDDKLAEVFSGVSSDFRDASKIWIVDGLCPAIDAVAKKLFGDRLVNISSNVGRYYQNGWDGKSYVSLFFGAVGLKRDKAIKHQLRHLGTPTIGLPKRYIALENHSITFGAPPVGQYQEMTARLGDIGIAVVQVGATGVPRVNGTVDARGMDLYDTYSIVKGAIGFVGRNSGNQSLMVFRRSTPLFEAGIPAEMSYSTIDYHDRVIRLRLDELPRLVPGYFA